LVVEDFNAVAVDYPDYSSGEVGSQTRLYDEPGGS
jgi:hypothetical protein